MSRTSFAMKLLPAQFRILITSKHLDFIDPTSANIIFIFFLSETHTKNIIIIPSFAVNNTKKSEAAKPDHDSLRLQSIILRSIIIHYNILFKYDLTEMSVCLTVEEIIFHSTVANETTARARKGSECQSERKSERFFFINIREECRVAHSALRYMCTSVVVVVLLLQFFFRSTVLLKTSTKARDNVSS